MKIWEIIGEAGRSALVGGRLDEMAKTPTEVRKRIIALSVPLVEHLVKLLKWEDERNYNKHAADVDTWAGDIQLLTRSKKVIKPSPSEYQEWMFTKRIPDVDAMTDIIKELKAYHKLPSIRSDAEVYDEILAIIYKMSFDLELNKFNTINDYLPSK